jgi:hypothetical protein
MTSFLKGRISSGGSWLGQISSINQDSGIVSFSSIETLALEVEVIQPISKPRIAGLSPDLDARAQIEDPLARSFS